MDIQLTGVDTDSTGEAAIFMRGTFSVPVDGETLAELFWQMHGERQAQFFNTLGAITVRDGYTFNVQLAYVGNNLDVNGRRLVRELADAMVEA